jgi:signal transduction histidine kinase
MLHGYIAWQEYRKHLLFKTATAHFNQALEANSRFLRVASHYLRTPLAKIQGALELMELKAQTPTTNPTDSPQSDGIDLTTLGSAKLALSSLSRRSEYILSESESFKRQQASVASSLDNVTVSSVIRQPEFLLPVSAILILTALLHILFIQADRYNTTILGLALVVVMGMVAIVALGTALYFKRQMYQLGQVDKLQQQANQELENSKQELINSIYSGLADDTDELVKLEPKLSNYQHANIFQTGVQELQYVVNKVNHFVEMSKLVPGLTWNTDLAPIVSSVVLDKQASAKAKQVEIITTAIPVAGLNIEPAKLDYILGAVLDNALQASPDNDRVIIDITKQAKTTTLAITDHGPGVPAEVKQSIFSPFTKTTDEEVFTNTGLGLDLALTRTILEQVGGSIEIKSAPTTSAPVQPSTSSASSTNHNPNGSRVELVVGNGVETGR